MTDTIPMDKEENTTIAKTTNDDNVIKNWEQPQQEEETDHH